MGTSPPGPAKVYSQRQSAPRHSWAGSPSRPVRCSHATESVAWTFATGRIPLAHSVATDDTAPVQIGVSDG